MSANRLVFDRRERSLVVGACVCGIVGTIIFVTGWAVLGQRLDGYSPISGAISEIARAGRETHSLMTMAIVAFGIAVCVFAFALRMTSTRPAWLIAITHGLCTLGVAATPLGTPRGDHFHNGFAGAAYVSLALLPWLASENSSSSRRRLLGRSASVLTGSALLVSTFGPSATTGLFQRTGFTVADMWIIWTASTIIIAESKSA